MQKGRDNPAPLALAALANGLRRLLWGRSSLATQDLLAQRRDMRHRAALWHDLGPRDALHIPRKDAHPFKIGRRFRAMAELFHLLLDRTGGGFGCLRWSSGRRVRVLHS